MDEGEGEKKSEQRVLHSGADYGANVTSAPAMPCWSVQCFGRASVRSN
jgi:hypothetical protein